MKRIVLPALAALVLLCACTQAPEPTQPVTEAPSSQTAGTQQSGTEESAESSEPSEAPTQAEPRFELTDRRLNVYRNRAEELWAQVIAEVKNTGDVPIVLEDAPMRVCDAEGNSLAADATVEAFPQIVLPGETGYYYVETYLEAENAEGLTLELEPKAAVAEETARYEVVQASLADSRYGGMELLAEVCNSTQETAKHFCIAALLLDADGHLLGMLSDVPFRTISAGATGTFELSSYMLPESLTTADVAETRVLAYELTEE